MTDLPQPTTPAELNQPVSTVYGPVRSWRYGRSLGVDLLFRNSICSFHCVYCQLGKINEHTAERKLYVATEKVIADFEESAWRESDIIAFSGNGEPTLAENLGEVTRALKAISSLPALVLTNATLLNDPAVRADLSDADEVACKLDAVDDEMLRKIDRPVEGITVESILRGIEALRADYRGKLSLQVMVLAGAPLDVTKLAAAIERTRPDEVQLNLPTRHIPMEWSYEYRGDHRPANRSRERTGREASVIASLADELRQRVAVPIVFRS